MKRTYKNPCYQCIILAKCLDRKGDVVSHCRKYNRFHNKFAKIIISDLLSKQKIDYDTHMDYMKRLYSPYLISITNDGDKIVFNLDNELDNIRD
jgi:hypothetical protein